MFSIGKSTALIKFQKGECFQEDIRLFLEKDFSKAEIKEIAGFHSFRVCYQMQSWKERDNLNPKGWCWK